MARINMAQIVMALALAAVLLQGTTADDHTVGDSTGWTSSLNSPNFYSNWANGKRFEVGDKLVFNFNAAAHDVATVTKDAYDACNINNPINITRTSPATVTLNATGEQYFICTFTGHCAAGQKLAVNVVNDDGNSTSPTSSPPTGTTSPTPPPPPPSGSSASPRGIAFAFVLMSLAIAFFC